MILSGLGVSAGTAVGRLFWLESVDASRIDAAPVEVSATSVEEALLSLDAAIAMSRDEIKRIAENARLRVGEGSAAIIRAQLLVLDDPEWLSPVQEAIRSGVAPHSAAWKTTEEIAAFLADMDDEYLRERSVDVLDVGQRVVGHLTKHPREEMLATISGDVIVGAHELTPTDTLALDLEVVRGVVTEVGARTSHAAILARQLGIPAVVGLTGLRLNSASGDLIIVDGDGGHCEINPDPEGVDRARRRAASVRRYEVIPDAVCTADGVRIDVLANAGSVEDVTRAVAAGADGIGLFRTEFLFMRSELLPSEHTQTEYYEAVVAAAEGRPVTFRTLDVGADKPLPGLPMPAEGNPFLGVRGIRLSLTHVEPFAAQLRALAAVADRHAGVSVMVPMVSGLEELDDVRALISKEAPGAPFRFGSMVEVPSMAVLAAELADEVDFISVGTNDLTAYLLAADRGNRDMQDLYTEFHPAVLRVLHQIRTLAGGTPVSLCGELASDSRALALLVALGYRRLSVSGPVVPAVKTSVRRLNAAALASEASVLSRACRHRDVEEFLSKVGGTDG